MIKCNESNGCNGCDGAAAQASQKVKRFIKDTNTYPKTAVELELILRGLNNHNYTIIDKIEREQNKKPLEYIQVDTFTGIKSFHKFEFNKESFEIKGTQTSDPNFQNITKIWTKPPNSMPNYN